MGIISRTTNHTSSTTPTKRRTEDKKTKDNMRILLAVSLLVGSVWSQSTAHGAWGFKFENGACKTDADCPDTAPVCLPSGYCQPQSCRTDADCSARAPHCHIGYGYCMPGSCSKNSGRTKRQFDADCAVGEAPECSRWYPTVCGEGWKERELHYLHVDAAYEEMMWELRESAERRAKEEEMRKKL